MLNSNSPSSTLSNNRSRELKEELELSARVLDEEFDFYKLKLGTNKCQMNFFIDCLVYMIFNDFGLLKICFSLSKVFSGEKRG